MDTTDTGAFTSSWIRVDSEAAANLVSDAYGIKGVAERLASERDDTFKVSAPGHATPYTLKISNPAECRDHLKFQDGALIHLEHAAPDLPLPRLVRTVSGLSDIDYDCGGQNRSVRMLTFLEGTLLVRTTPSSQQSHNIGVALAKLGLALSSYRPTAPQRRLIWDLTYFSDLAEKLSFVDDSRRPVIDQVLRDFSSSASARLGQMQRQIIHNDFNPHNIIVDPIDHARIRGIIDFGDMVMAPIINDLAVAASYHLSTPQWRDLLGALVRGYHSIRSLAPDELAILPILVKARLAMTVIITEWRSNLRPLESAYILRNHGPSWTGLANLLAQPDAETAAQLIHICKE